MTSWASVLIRRLVASVVFVWATSHASASASTILSINPAMTVVNVGDTVTVNIDIADVDDLFTFSFELLFDQTVLQFQNIAEGPLTNANPTFFIPGALLDPSSALGTITATGNLLFDPVSGPGTLAVATFLATMATTAGPSSIAFHDVVLEDLSGALEFSVVNAEVEVAGVTSTVPEEPSAIIVMLSVLALAGCRWLVHAP